MKGDPIVVVKVGGSLFDLPDLKPRLRRFVANLRTKRKLLVPGGGEPADYIRRLQPIHGFSDAAAHDLALQAMSFQGAILQEFFPKAVFAEMSLQVKEAWAAGKLPILDPLFILNEIEMAYRVRFPKDWSFTSDSVAAAVAAALRADRLVLLKSRAAKVGLTWEQHTKVGLVDPCFARVSQSLPTIDVIDFRGRRLRLR